MRWWRPVVLVVLVVTAAVVTLSAGVPTVEELRIWVAAAGWAAPVAYAALYAGLSLTPTPASVLSIGAGALFGFGLGIPVVLVGAIGGAVAGFLLTRHLGRGAVEQIGSERLARLDAMLGRNGLVTMIGIRLAPIIPFAVLNMGCGLTGLRTRDYVLGTAIGMSPGIIAFAAIGAFGADPTGLPFLLSLGGLALLFVASAVVARRRRAAAPPPVRAAAG